MNAKKNKTLNIDRELIIKRYIMASDQEKILLEQLFGDKVKPFDITDQIQTFEDILEYNGVKEIDFNTACIGLEPDEIAYKQLKLISKAYNSFESENNKTKEKAFVVYATSKNGSKNINLSICEFGVEVISRIGFINMEHASDATKNSEISTILSIWITIKNPKRQIIYLTFKGALSNGKVAQLVRANHS